MAANDQPVAAQTWQDSLDQGFIARLMRPVERPGIIGTSVARGILTRAGRLAERAQRPTELARRFASVESGARAQRPIVYARPAPVAAPLGDSALAAAHPAPARPAVQARGASPESPAPLAPTHPVGQVIQRSAEPAQRAAATPAAPGLPTRPVSGGGPAETLARPVVSARPLPGSAVPPSAHSAAPALIQRVSSEPAPTEVGAPRASQAGRGRPVVSPSTAASALIQRTPSDQGRHSAPGQGAGAPQDHAPAPSPAPLRSHSAAAPGPRPVVTPLTAQRVIQRSITLPVVNETHAPPESAHGPVAPVTGAWREPPTTPHLPAAGPSRNAAGRMQHPKKHVSDPPEDEDEDDLPFDIEELAELVKKKLEDDQQATLNPEDLLDRAERRRRLQQAVEIERRGWLG